jgi:hypothetical protein
MCKQTVSNVLGIRKDGDLVGRSVFRVIALAGGIIGSIVPDLDHLASIVLKNKAIWSVLHSDILLYVFVGVAITCLCGQISIYFLKRRK